MTANRNFVIENGTIYTPSKMIEDGVLVVQDGKITYVGSKSSADFKRDIPKIDADGLIVCPGFIDLQSNGGGGVFLTEDGTYRGVCEMAKAHVRFGTTSLIPTVITTSTEKICTALKAVAQATLKGTGGACVLGSHLEGPFINIKKKGAHNPKFIKTPSIAEFDKFYSASEDTMKVLTLAPELEGSLDLISHAVKRGIAVSVGHSIATYTQMRKAVESGLSLATHIFNAMEGLGSREPGTVGAILSSNEIKTGLIADGIHVHPMSMRIVVEAKSYKNVFLVTDSMPPVGTDLSSFKLYDQTIYVKEGGCYAADGTIAGSALSMNVAVKTMHERVGVSLKEAITMATEVPAKAIGILDTKGSLSVGKDADVVICTRDLQIFKVIVEGDIAYDAY